MFQKYLRLIANFLQISAKYPVPPPSLTVEFKTAVGPVDTLQALRLGCEALATTLSNIYGTTLISFGGDYIVVRNFLNDEAAITVSALPQALDCVYRRTSLKDVILFL